MIVAASKPISDASQQLGCRYFDSTGVVMKAIAIAMVVLSLSACSTFATKAGPQIAKGVNRYCAESLQERLLVRQTVNDSIAPNKIAVTCAGDPQ